LRHGIFECERTSPRECRAGNVLSVYMMIHDYGLRYVSPRRWCWRAENGSWRTVPKWSAKLYLKVKCGLGKSPVKNPVPNTIDAAMNEAVETFRVDLAGNYDFDREIRSAVDSFYRKRYA
jgi:hypothetical protein